MCEICNKSFTQMSRLRKHRNQHTRPFKCDVRPCDSRGFALKKDLARHKATCHKDVTSITIKHNCPEPSCPYARAGFLRKDNCNRHIRRITLNLHLRKLQFQLRAHHLHLQAKEKLYLNSRHRV